MWCVCVHAGSGLCIDTIEYAVWVYIDCTTVVYIHLFVFGIKLLLVFLVFLFSAYERTS